MIKVKLDLPFYVYIDRQAKNRDQIVEMLETTVMSNHNKLPDSLLKPNYAFLQGKLSFYQHFNHQIPEIVISNKDQIQLSPK